MVHPVSNSLDIGSGEAADVRSLGHKSANQYIGTFVGTALIGTVWMRIVDLPRSNATTFFFPD